MFQRSPVFDNESLKTLDNKTIEDLEYLLKNFAKDAPSLVEQLYIAVINNKQDDLKKIATQLQVNSTSLCLCAFTNACAFLQSIMIKNDPAEAMMAVGRIEHELNNTISAINSNSWKQAVSGPQQLEQPQKRTAGSRR